MYGQPIEPGGKFFILFFSDFPTTMLVSSINGKRSMRRVITTISIFTLISRASTELTRETLLFIQTTHIYGGIYIYIYIRT